MHRIRTTILSVALVALAVTPAFAQRQRGQFGNRQGRGVAALLQVKEVQTEIKATDDELAAVTKITDKYKDDIAAARAAQPPDRDKLTELGKKVNDDVTKALPDIFKPDQVKRINQLVVQSAGMNAFTKDDVATALKLTDDQKKSIKDATDELTKDAQDLFQNAQGADRAAAFTKIQTMRKDALDKVVNGLTDDQKKTWKDLTGDKFDFPAPMRGNRGNRGNGTPGNRGNRTRNPNPNP